MAKVSSIVSHEFHPYHLPLRKMEPPGSGHVHIWFIDLAALGNPLKPDERIDSASLTPMQKRTMRRFYLRLLLGAYLDIPGKDVAISRAVKGKPVLDHSVHSEPLEFSVAASGGCCLIALTSSATIGVDLEPVNRQANKPLQLARRYFSAAEYDELRAMPEDQLQAAFLHTWACKEAVVKAAGEGIANQLCRFSVSVLPWEPPTITAMEDDDPQAWRLAVFQPGPNHFGAVTVRYPSLELACSRLLPAT